MQPTRNAIIILLEACKRLTAYLLQAPAVAESLKQVRLIIKPINIVCGLLGAWLSLCIVWAIRPRSCDVSCPVTPHVTCFACAMG